MILASHQDVNYVKSKKLQNLSSEELHFILKVEFEV